MACSQSRTPEGERLDSGGVRVGGWLLNGLRGFAGESSLLVLISRGQEKDLVKGRYRYLFYVSFSFDLADGYDLAATEEIFELCIDALDPSSTCCSFRIAGSFEIEQGGAQSNVQRRRWQ